MTMKTRYAYVVSFTPGTQHGIRKLEWDTSRVKADKLWSGLSRGLMPGDKASLQLVEVPAHLVPEQDERDQLTDWLRNHIEY